MAHESCLKIAALLKDHELCVCELEDMLDIRQVNLSKHLHRMKQAGLGDSRRESNVFKKRIAHESEHVFRRKAFRLGREHDHISGLHEVLEGG